MLKLTDENLIRQRIKHPATDIQLQNDYKEFGEEGKKIIEWIQYFDNAEIHNPNVYKRINEFYQYMKLITPDFCYSEEKVILLRNIAEEIKWIDLKFSDNSIIDELPIFNPQKHSPDFKLINAENIEDILNEIVYWTRFMLSRPFFDQSKLINFNLVNRCEDASRYIYQLARVYNLNAHIIKIPAAFSNTEYLYDSNVGYHYFVIIEIDSKSYIVDCTYAQFFSWYRNQIDRLGNYSFCGCNPGIFMIMNEEREKVARKILKDGWIELTDKNISLYLDGFAISYRNGLYYEYIGTADYQSHYNVEDYQNFLFTDDSQLKREGRKYLGYQLKPLQKSDFKF